MSGTDEGEIKTARLTSSGGSKSLTLPKLWLEALGIEDTVTIVRSEAGILIQPAPVDDVSIEHDPEFAQFLEFVRKDALRHPEQLGDIGDLLGDDDELVVGVEPL